MALHKVIYGQTVDGVRGGYQRSYKDHLINEWCREHCQGQFYFNPGWTTDKFVEFERSEDAVLFALRWI